jgi:ABC-type multidrug transport system permease subunit
MKSLLITILALIVKGAIIYTLLIFALKYYKQDLPFYVQNPLVWLLVYLPVFMGYESLINVIFSNKKKDAKGSS